MVYVFREPHEDDLETRLFECVPCRAAVTVIVPLDD
jgi:hypothetical protein